MSMVLEREEAVMAEMTEARFEELAERITRFEGRHNDRLQGIDKRIDRANGRVDKVYLTLVTGAVGAAIFAAYGMLLVLIATRV
jgi:hypothetical protein